jgi:hypothetical protein
LSEEKRRFFGVAILRGGSAVRTSTVRILPKGEKNTKNEKPKGPLTLSNKHIITKTLFHTLRGLIQIHYVV